MEETSFHFIGGEEEKSEQEPLRLWGHIEDGVIVKAETPVITTQCIRVPVLNGPQQQSSLNSRRNQQRTVDRELVNFSGLHRN